MTLVVCLDDNLGMMFNHRRQSRDRVLIKDLMDHVGDRRLVVSSYSVSLFPADDPRVVVAADPWVAAGEDDLVFAEDTDPASAWDKVSEVLLYRWNRIYPADRHFRGDMSGFLLTETTEFVGSSHDRITKEVWKLC